MPSDCCCDYQFENARSGPTPPISTVSCFDVAIDLAICYEFSIVSTVSSCGSCDLIFPLGYSGTITVWNEQIYEHCRSREGCNAWCTAENELCSEGVGDRFFLVFDHTDEHFQLGMVDRVTTAGGPTWWDSPTSTDPLQPFTVTLIHSVSGCDVPSTINVIPVNCPGGDP